MSKTTQKIASVGLSIITMVSLSGIAPVAFAQTSSSTAALQAQIAALLAQVQQLQAQLSSNGGSTVSTTSSYTFSSNLTVGSKGADVKALQQFLNGHGYTVATSGAGSAGNESTYFGPATKAALAKFQAANGVSPAVGYFGPLTRAKVNSMSTTTTTTTGGSNGSTTTTTTTGAPMTVTVASDSPVAQSLASGAVNVAVLKLNFTAGTKDVTVTNLALTRSGLSQDADLNNTYLYDGATRLATNLGINNGRMQFANGTGLFTVPANTTKEITVTADVSTTATAGRIIVLGINSASDIVTADGSTFGGTFPVTSGNFTVASVTNLAALTISGYSSSTVTVNAGQTNYLVAQFTMQASNNPAKVTYVRFTNIGSVTPSYLQNIRLMNGSTQLGATVPALDSSNVVAFDLSNNPLMLTSGQTVNLSLYADVTGGVNRTFQFSIQQASDVHGVDTMYGVGIGATVSGYSNGAGFPVQFYAGTINNGGLVISKSSSTPSTYVVAGNTNQVLAKFDVLASGDAIKFNELDFSLAGGQSYNNFRVVDDQGVQIGTTASTLTAATYAAGSGNLNYIIPANQTRTLTVYGDLSSTASGTLAITLGGGSSSAQSYTTFSSVTVPSTGGNSLSVLASTSNLTAALNYGLGSPVNASAGSQALKVASFSLTAGQINSISLTGVTIQTAANSTTAGYLRNVKVMIGSTQIGNSYATVTASQTMTFNASSPISIPANSTANVDVYADVASSVTATTTNTLITLSGVNANTTGGNSVSIGTTPGGQNVSFNNGGTLTAAVAAGTPSAQYVGMGVTGVTVAQYQFTASSAGDATLTKVVLVDSASASTSTTAATDQSTFINYRLVDGATQIGTAPEASSGTITFNLTGSVVSANTYKTLSLVADVNSFPYASSSGAHAFALTNMTYTNSAGATSTAVSTSNIGNLFTVYRTSLNLASGPSFTGPTSIGSGNGKIVSQFTFTAGTGYDAVVKSFTLSQNGSVIQASTTVPVEVYDSSNSANILGTSTLASTTASTFTLNGSTGWTVPAGQTRVLVVQINGSPANTVSSTNSNGTYQDSIGTVTWSDGTTSSISTLSPAINMGTAGAGQTLTNLSN